MSLATQGVRFGAFTPTLVGGDAMEAVNLWEMRLGRRMDLVNAFRKWGGDSGNFGLAAKSLKQAAANGRSPLVSWEPLNWDATLGPYRLSTIVAGNHDAYLRQWAEGVRALGFDIYFRPMHEMNGNWYPWSGEPELYVAAWRYIVDIFDEYGADNAKWVWCVNAADVGGIPMERYWPGSSYVDVMGIDGYNCYGGWRSFSQINMNAYNRLCALDPDREVWMVETATDEARPEMKGAFTATAVHSKAEWIRDMWATEGMERVTALLWFDERNPSSYDWRIDTSSVALHELRRQLAAATGYVPAPPPYVPPVPEKVTVVPGVRAGSVVVSWRGVPSFARGYKVLRKTTSFSVLQTVPRTQTSVAITGLDSGSLYSFAVQSYTLVRNSAASGIVSCFVP